MSLQRQRDRSYDLLRLLDDRVMHLLEQARAGAWHIDLAELGNASTILATLQKLDFELFMRIGRRQDEEQSGVADYTRRRRYRACVRTGRRASQRKTVPATSTAMKLVNATS